MDGLSNGWHNIVGIYTGNITRSIEHISKAVKMVGTKPNVEDVAHSYLRKIRKPMVEKKRRERMNSSITQLKQLITDTIKQNVAPMTRVDKADILELAVVHLAQLKQQQQHPQKKVAMTTDASGYSNGYKDCAREVVTFLSANNVVDGTSINDLSSHLHSTYMFKSRMESVQVNPLRPKINYSTPLRYQSYVETAKFTPVSLNEYSPILQTSPDISDCQESFSPCFSSGLSHSSTGSLEESTTYSSMEYTSSVSNSDTEQSSDLVTIGIGKENAIGHVINDTMWRPW